MFDDLPDSQIDAFFDMFMATFDEIIASKGRFFKLCQSPEFLEIYKEKDYPAYFERFIPIVHEGEVKLHISLEPATSGSNRDYVDRANSLLKEALSESNEAKKEELKEAAYNTVIGLRCWIVDMIANTQFGQSVSDLLELTRAGDKDAFVKLVELDSTFLTTDFAYKIIRMAEISQDLDFKKKLSIALDPFKKPRILKRQRDKYALQLINILGLKRRTLKEWANFLTIRGFDNYSDEKTLTKAFNRLERSKKYKR